MSLENITLDDMKVIGRDKPKPSVQEIQQPQQETQEAQQSVNPDKDAPLETENQSTPPSTEQPEAPAFNFKEKTEGRYENFDQLWSEFTELQSREPEVKEVEKERDFKDDYIKKAVAYYEENGDLIPFLEATRFNYDEMSDEEVLQKKMRDEYKGLAPRAFKKKFEDYLEKNFGSDEDDEVRKELIRFEAKKVRDELKAKQQNFLKVEAKPKEQTPEVNPSAELEKWKNIVQSDDSVKSLKEKKGISIKYGDEEFTYELDNPDAIVEQAIDDSKFWSNFATERDGKPAVDIGKFNKVAAYASNPEDYEKRLIEYGMSLGKSNVIDDLENPTEIKTPRREGDGSPTGDIMDEWLEAVKKTKRRI